jgi:hypothetical protein
VAIHGDQLGRKEKNWGEKKKNVPGGHTRRSTGEKRKKISKVSGPMHLLYNVMVCSL